MKDCLKILVATDYSDPARDAGLYAARLAIATNSALIFLHVYQIPFNSPPDPVEFADNAEKLRKSEMKCLEQHCFELFSSLRISSEDADCEYVVREGSNTEKQIIAEAEESNSDFIITGTHGVSGFRNLFFGSRAWNVIKKSHCPVLAIPRGAFYTGIRKIVFGIEYREGEIRNLNYVVHLARMFNAEIMVLHVTNYVLTKRFEREMFETFKNEIKSKISYERLKVHLLVSQSISEAVHDFCAENEIDLLVMSPRRPFLFDKYFAFNMMSMTRKAILHTRVPFLAVPDFYDSHHAGFPQTASAVKFSGMEEEIDC